MIRHFRSPYLWILLFLSPGLFRLATWKNQAPERVDIAAAANGRELFEHEWTAGDPLAGKGDGLGPVFNANSCVACHRQGGAGGSGSLENNITTFTIRAMQPGQSPRQGVVHALLERLHAASVEGFLWLGLWWFCALVLAAFAFRRLGLWYHSVNFRRPIF